MSKFELKLPKMGESVAEATITSWLKEVGDTIELDEAIVEIATDKVDTELPSEVKGVLIEKLFNVDDVAQVGQTIAIIETESDNDNKEVTDEDDGVIRPSDIVNFSDDKTPDEITTIDKSTQIIEEMVVEMVDDSQEQTSDKFYSPLVKNIAKQEGVSLSELETISGTGKDSRVTKNDILNYIEDKKSAKTVPDTSKSATVNAPKTTLTTAATPFID